MQCQPPHTPWFPNRAISKRHVVIAHSLRSGQVPLNKFGGLMKKVSSPNCEPCGIIQDVYYHLLVACVQ